MFQQLTIFSENTVLHLLLNMLEDAPSFGWLLRKLHLWWPSLVLKRPKFYWLKLPTLRKRRISGQLVTGPCHLLCVGLRTTLKTSWNACDRIMPNLASPLGRWFSSTKWQNAYHSDSVTWTGCGACMSPLDHHQYIHHQGYQGAMATISHVYSKGWLFPHIVYNGLFFIHI